MFLSSDRYQMPAYRVAHVLCYISVSISPTTRNLRKNVHLFTISPHIIGINKRTSVCLLSTSGFRLDDGLSSQKNTADMHFASCCLCRHLYSSTYDGRCRHVTPYPRFKVALRANQRACMVPSSCGHRRQVDEVLTVIHSLMVMDVTK